MKKNRIVLCCLSLVMVLFMNACREDPVELSDEANILSFKITRALNPSLSKDYEGIIDNPNFFISVALDDDYALNQLIPSLEVSPGAVVSPESGTPVDFTKTVTYTVTAASGVRQVYTVNLSTPGGVPSITGILIDNIPCIYDGSSDAYFFSVKDENQGSIRILCQGQNIAAVSTGDFTTANNSTVILPGLKPGNTLEIKPSSKSGKKGEAVKLVVSSLPLVHIEVSGTIVNKPKIDCNISLIDPWGLTNDSLRYFPPHFAGIELRGGLAQSFPKKSYSFEFRSSGTMEVDSGTKLLGLRDDGDWILDAMYIDHARMRNRLSTDLWIDMNKVPYLSKEPRAINGTRGYFVEVFLNNSYLGLYCLTERIDRKQLQLSKKEGFSYKASHWSSSTEFVNGNAAIDNNSDDWDGWELEYQAETAATSIPQVKWQPLRDFIRYTALSTDNDFIMNIGTKTEISNLVDYLLFMNAVGADDNTGKNTFFSFHSNSRNKFFITPWDLDASWGRKWEGSKIDLRNDEFIGVTGIPGTDSRYCRPNAYFIRMMNLNPGGFRNQLKTRWQQLRQNELSMPQLTARVETYRRQFSTSGAFERERKKWPAYITDINTETQFMLSWIQNRMNQVDAYLNGL
ncbi:MAG: CotH kinase family protein [Prolixibacteraceae bacterium]|nr:CotH kinase family protein [Prolixibacteraceae bacterium]HOS01249.1 CotH kinase family protein [Prolixibacteraceae bacterium]HOS91269.1 CotH kinase family protein [Prolixibacteraceae bacterium]HPL46354.1 CotH kinase family protein [Prolixibacteraceae bacterium]HQE53085.1 CotH kinase family protein [Prolixibacteraceae bacterium]